MREINHENLSHFVGVVFEPPLIFVVSEFYQRGGLKVHIEIS